MELSLGDIVETVKGASFWGKIIGLHAIGAVNPGAVVEAIDPGFAGTRHVYPLTQLRRRPAQTPEGWQLVPIEPTDEMGMAALTAQQTRDDFGSEHPSENPHLTEAEAEEIGLYQDSLAANPARWLKPLWRAMVRSAPLPPTGGKP